MKPAGEYNSEAEIRADANNVVEELRTLEKWRELNPALPPAPPVPDPGECRRLGDIRARLTASRDQWTNLAALENKFATWLPDAVGQLRTLESTTPPDAPDAVIDSVIRLTRRVQLGQQFLGGIQPRREAVNRELIGALHELNGLVRKFSASRFPPHFFLSGPTPVHAIAEALAAIDALLK